MEEKLITLETAKIAKEKGFDEKGEYYYLSPHYDILMGLDRTGYNMYPTKKNSDGKGSIIVVTQSLLQRWLREEHGVNISIHPKITPSNSTVYYAYKGTPKNDWIECHETYELALEDELLKMLNTI